MAPELKLNSRLKGLMNACQKSCVAECCGIEAFDFSPLHVASHLSAFTGTICQADVNEFEGYVDALLAAASNLPPDEQELICSIEDTNQYFTRNTLNQFATRLKRSIRL